MTIFINHPSFAVPDGVETWSTQQLTDEFNVEGFLAPYVVVRRKSDNARFSLQFTGGGGEPRVYFDLKPA